MTRGRWRTSAERVAETWRRAESRTYLKSFRAYLFTMEDQATNARVMSLRHSDLGRRCGVAARSWQVIRSAVPEAGSEAMWERAAYHAEQGWLASIGVSSPVIWWYEVAKGNVLSTATRCRACRHQERAQKAEVRLKGGDPHPYKSPGLLLARLRREIEPRLLSVGYRRVGTNPRGASRILFVDHLRSNEQFTLTWDQHTARLTAQRLTAGGADLEEIAKAEFDGVMSTSEIEARLAPFKVSVERFLDAIGGPMQGPQSQGESSGSENSSDG